MVIPASVGVEPWQREAAALPVAWSGDLNDDCTAEWAGLVLRAEQMDRKHWWWAVYDAATSEIITDSNASAEIAVNGKFARAAVETAAKEWLAQGPSPNTSLERTRER